ncbi:uncharacterized protein LOC112343277 [Selaginella moellendorffii]|uniref:uncharacterized protein LOC112343277 n=1 Tax=Selaginella moellendorffii TaxID=88036 RepID=UPI000D1C32E6|nr:uncharacterized protein LOC112343277 [Selaginella moellendorffii]|eukprot:XP_024522220.1 uncharacterized protein LOC112343277 [Selaginella moellendorffii]
MTGGGNNAEVERTTVVESSIETVRKHGEAVSSALAGLSIRGSALTHGNPVKMEDGCGSVKAEASASIAAGCDPMKVDGLVKMEAGFESARVEAPVGSVKMEPGGGFSKRLKLPGTRRPGDAGFVLASSCPSIFPSLKPKVRRSSLSTRRFGRKRAPTL